MERIEERTKERVSAIKQHLVRAYFEEWMSSRVDVTTRWGSWDHQSTGGAPSPRP